MKNKKQGATKIAMAILAILLASTLVMLLNNEGNSTVSALYSSTYDERVDPVTGEPYGDLMQYEWPTGGHDQSHTRFSPGPAPDSPDVLWKVEVPGLMKDPHVTVFNGKAFVLSRDTLYAFDAFTGDLIWQIPHRITLAASNYVTKIDDEYLFLYNRGQGIACYEIDTGTQVWNITGYALRLPGAGSYWQGIFSTELKMQYVVTYDIPTDKCEVLAFDLSDPSKQASIAWRTTIDQPGEILSFGGGKLFLGSYRYQIYAFDGRNGTLLWKAPKIGQAGYSAIYYDGKLYHSCSSTRLTCYDGNNGTILWDYNALDYGERAFFAWAGAAAYGNYYQHNINVPVGFFAAWDAETGDVVWKKDAYLYQGYLCPSVADGKVYVTKSDGWVVAGREAMDVSTACFDAFTGEILWEIPFYFGQPAIAYGNLYGAVVYGKERARQVSGTLYCIGSSKPKNWSMWRGNTDDPGVGQSCTANISTPRWKYETGGPVTSSPAVVDGKVYVGSQDQNIYCLDAYSGSLFWKFPIDYAVLSSPAVVDGRVYTGADDGYIYCIDAETGNQIWKTPAGGKLPIVFPPMWQPRSSPIVVNNRLFVGALDGKVYCLDTSGSIEWTYQTGAPIGGSPAYANGVVYIASTDAYIYALDAANGNLIWKIMTPARPVTNYQHLFLVGSPTVGDGKVFIGGGHPGDPIVLALDAENGTVVWNSTLHSGSFTCFTPTYFNGVLYFPSGMWASAYNATDGTEIWLQWLGHESFSSMAYADDLRGARLYIGCDVYSITCINATDGKPLSIYTTDAQVQSSPAIWDGKMYIGSADWHVYCFDDSPTVCTDIWAVPDKGAEMWNNETLTISGKLRAIQTYEATGDVFTPPIVEETVTVTLVDPDMNEVNLDATTDMDGNFGVSYSPTKVGNWSWMAWYEGKDFLSHSYSEAFGEAHFVEVTSPPTQEPSNGNGEEPPPEEGIPMEYVYAIVAVIAIAIIAVATYVYMKRKK